MSPSLFPRGVSAARKPLLLLAFQTAQILKTQRGNPKMQIEGQPQFPTDRTPPPARPERPRIAKSRAFPLGLRPIGLGRRLGLAAPCRLLGSESVPRLLSLPPQRRSALRPGKVHPSTPAKKLIDVFPDARRRAP